MTGNDSNALEEGLISSFFHPVQPQHFFNNHWGQEPFFVSHSSREFSEIPPLDVDRLFQAIRELKPRQHDIRVSAKGKELDSSTFSKRGLVMVSEVERLWNDGATVIVNASDVFFPWLGTFCEALESWLGHPITSRLYLTPANSWAFGAHQDGHDVFILQLAGSKLWKFWPKESSPEDEASATLQVMAPNDLLYLPINTWHDVRTASDFSIHATIGVHLTTWRMLLDWALDELPLEGSNSLADRLPQNTEGQDLLPLLMERLTQSLGGASLDLRKLYQDRLRNWTDLR